MLGVTLLRDIVQFEVNVCVIVKLGKHVLTTRSDLFLADILGYFYSTRLSLLLRLGRGFVLVIVLYLSFVLKRIAYGRLFLCSGKAFV